MREGSGLSIDRVTPIGRCLRYARLDELPQLWNVLKGEMSLIGPRPETTLLSAVYATSVPNYIARQTVLPGITGLAQVQRPRPNTAAEKLPYDLAYIDGMSFGQDLWIVWKTVRLVGHAVIEALAKPRPSVAPASKIPSA